MNLFYKCVKIVVVIFVLLWIGVMCVSFMKPDLYNSWKTKMQNKWNSWFGSYHMRDDGIL